VVFLYESVVTQCERSELNIADLQCNAVGLQFSNMTVIDLSASESITCMKFSILLAIISGNSERQSVRAHLDIRKDREKMVDHFALIKIQRVPVWLSQS